MDEFGVVDHIENFGKINCPSQFAGWGMRLIEVLSYFMRRRAGKAEGLGWKT